MKGLLAGMMVALLLVVSASAAPPVRLVFNRPEATPHTLVTAKTSGRGALLRFRKRTLRAYFQADPLVPLGKVSVNRKGNGTLYVNVPNVPPGDYPVVLKGLPGSPRLRVVGSFRVVDGPASRACDQSVYGRLADDWRARAHSIGPVHILGYDASKASDPAWNAFARDRATGEFAIKVLLVIDRGPRVTLAVAAEDREGVALTYIPMRFNIHRVIDQDAAVTFEPCPDSASTQFNGGFVFKQPLCAHFNLLVEGRPEPIRFALPLGKPCAAT